MRIEKTYSHLNGEEWLLVHRPAIWREIKQVVGVIDAERCRTKRSKEKRKQGSVLYSPIALNKEFKRLLKAEGWSEVKTNYWVTDDFNLIRQTIAIA